VPNITGTYVNDRNTTMTYDQAGNITDPHAANSSGEYWKYDSAGRLSSAFRVRNGQFSEGRLHYEYDGDGRTATFDSYYDNYLPTYTTYGHNYQFFIRSSVLGGEVLAEIEVIDSLDTLNDPKQFVSKSYVYLNGERLAYQYNMHLSAADASGTDIVGHFGKHVRWMYREPIIRTDSWHYRMNFSTDLASDMNSDTFVDPTGSEVTTFDPALIPPPPPPIDPPILVFRYYGEGDRDWSGGCVVDGRPMDCGITSRLLRSGAFQLGLDSFQHNILTPPTFPRDIPSISLRSLGDLLFSKLPSSGIVNVDPRTPPFANGFLAAQQGGGQNQGVQPSCLSFATSLVDILRDSPFSGHLLPGVLGRTLAHDRIGKSMVKRAIDNVDVDGRSYIKGPNLPVGFRQDLIDNGQGGDVYHHIEFVAGQFFLGTTGQTAIEAFIAKDRDQAQHGRLESVTELRDDEAGRRVGKAMLDAFNSVSKDDDSKFDDLVKQLRGILCAP
jgi:YD repeat-containing protein